MEELGGREGINDKNEECFPAMKGKCVAPGCRERKKQRSRKLWSFRKEGGKKRRENGAPSPCKGGRDGVWKKSR